MDSQKISVNLYNIWIITDGYRILRTIWFTLTETGSSDRERDRLYRFFPNNKVLRDLIDNQGAFEEGKNKDLATQKMLVETGERKMNILRFVQSPLFRNTISFKA